MFAHQGSRPLRKTVLALGLLAIVLFDIFVLERDPALAAPGDHWWSRGFPGPTGGGPSDYVSVAVNGTLISIAGGFEGDVGFGGSPLASEGGTDIYVARYDALGNHLWSRRFGDVSDQQAARDVGIDAAGNTIIAGGFFGSVDFGGGTLTSAGGNDVFVAKFDPAGNHIWSKRFGDADGQKAYGLSVRSDGQILVVGQAGGAIDFGGGPLVDAGATDAFAAVLGGDGTHIWSARFGDTSSQSADVASYTPDGGFVIGGQFYGTITLGGPTFTSAGASDIFLAKFGPDQSYAWSRGMGGITGEAVHGVDASPTGEVVMVGAFFNTVDFGGGPLSTSGSGDADMFAAKYSNGGVHVWSRQFGDGGSQSALDVDVDPAGDVVATGILQGSIDFGGDVLSSAGSTDVFVAKLDSNAGHVWSHRYGAAFIDQGMELVTDSAGDVAVVGHFSSTVDFGGGPTTSAGDRDTFLLKIAGCPGAACDSDGDGCSDGEELLSNPSRGGVRNPSFHYDFYDVDGTKKIDAIDIAMVRANWNPFGPVPPEDVIFDRSVGAAAWAPGAPDNRINALDVALVRASFSHDCNGPP